MFGVLWVRCSVRSKPIRRDANVQVAPRTRMVVHGEVTKNNRQKGVV